MNVDSLRKKLTASESEGVCLRRNEVSDLQARDINLKNDGTANKSRGVRRKRMELRRGNSIHKGKSAGDGLVSTSHDVALKKRRSEVRNAHDFGGFRYGKIAHLGRRREMEDAVAVELGFLKKDGQSYDFYGVYDGHGGARVAGACSEMMHEFLANALEDESGAEIGWEKVMTTAFKDMDAEVNKNGADVEAMGSTAVVTVVGEEVLVVANCGDSRVVICRGGVAVQLSDDHKPDRPDEQERIEVLGGKVINWNGARVLGVLATSRSIEGDHYLKPYVISNPEVKIINRTSTDEFLILASDGLWDVVPNELACRVTRRCLDGRVKSSSLISRVIDKDIEEGDQFDKTNENRGLEAAAVLAELAMTKGSTDNVSVIVVDVS
ncbi:hypothetical protein OROHE_021880 [Orobanche hederae]